MSKDFNFNQSELFRFKLEDKDSHYDMNNHDLEIYSPFTSTLASQKDWINSLSPNSNSSNERLFQRNTLKDLNKPNFRKGGNLTFKDVTKENWSLFSDNWNASENENSSFKIQDVSMPKENIRNIQTFQHLPPVPKKMSFGDMVEKENFNSSIETNADLLCLMKNLSLITPINDVRGAVESSLQVNIPSITNRGCVFCKKNGYHSTFYLSHVLKDENGFCQCPVLQTYVCPLCKSTGINAHTLKYCPRNAVTHGDPISAGLPPGKVNNWKDVAVKLNAFRRY